MKLTTAQLKQIIREEIARVALHEGIKPKTLNKSKLQKILDAATVTKSQYGYPILKKGWVTKYMTYINKVEGILKAGEEKFNPEAAIDLSDRIDGIPDGWESVASAGKEWTAMDHATTLLVNALYHGEWDALVKYWNDTLCPAVDKFKL